jgi:hypothetical protein
MHFLPRLTHLPDVSAKALVDVPLVNVRPKLLSAAHLLLEYPLLKAHLGPQAHILLNGLGLRMFLMKMMPLVPLRELHWRTKQ